METLQIASTIEQHLDEFFKELQHTPGPWKQTPASRGKFHQPEEDRTKFFIVTQNVPGNGPTADICTCEKGGHTFKFGPTEYQHDITLPIAAANSKLIAQAPAMLRSLCRTYLTLLTLFHYGTGTHAQKMMRISLDGPLASIRNEISSATGLECQYLQDKFEGYATAIVN